MAFNIKAYHPSRVIKFVEASRASGDHRVSSQPPVLPTRLHLYNKKPFLGICFKKCQDFSRCPWSTGTFLQIIFIVDNLFNCRGEPLHLNLSIQGRRNRSIASATNPIMPRLDFASPPLFFFLVCPLLPLLEGKEQESRFRVDPFHFNNLHLPRRPLRGAEFRMQRSERLGKR